MNINQLCTYDIHSLDPCPFDNIEYFFSLHIELEWQCNVGTFEFVIDYHFSGCNSQYLPHKQIRIQIAKNIGI